MIRSLLPCSWLLLLLGNSQPLVAQHNQLVTPWTESYDAHQLTFSRVTPKGPFASFRLEAPGITLTGPLVAFSTCEGTPSAEQSFTISGVDLTTDVLVTPPSGFEVSLTSGGPFTPTIQLTPTGGAVSATVYIRLSGALPVGPGTTITASSAGATDATLTATGTTSTSVAADAGPDRTACVSPGTTSLAAVAPASGSGAWSFVSGPNTATVTSPSNAATTVVGLTVVGNYRFRWTVTSGTCITSDSIDVVVSANPAPFSILGGGTSCQNIGTVLRGPSISGLNYAWGKSFLAAPFTPIGANRDTLAVTQSGVYQLVVSNAAGCTATSTTNVNVADFVFNGSLTGTDAQQTGRLNRFANISICATPKACPLTFATTGSRSYDSYTITNTQNSPVCATVGLNSGCGTAVFVVAYSGSFNPTSLCTNYLADPGSSPATSIFFEVPIPANGTVVLVVHEVNPGQGCANYSLTVDLPRETPAITANPALSVCSGTPVTLTASSANSYSWTPGGATTNTINITPTAAANYSVELGYGNNGCIDNASASITLLSPTTAQAGNDTSFCALTGNLSGNMATVGTGSWTQVDGPGTVNFTDATDPTTSASASAYGTYRLRWAIGTTGTCAATSADTVLVSFNDPAASVNAGADQPICLGNTSTSLAAVVSTIGTGTWSFLSGPATASLANASQSNTTVTGLTAAGTYQFVWTVTNGACNAVTDTMQVLVAQPTMDAVANQTVCNNESTTAVNFTGGGTGVTYNWTNNTPGIGLAASGAGDISSFTAVNTTNAPITATITVTPTTAGGSPAPTPEILYYKFDGTGTSVPNLASAPPTGAENATTQGGVTQGAAGVLCNTSLVGSGVSSTTDFLNTNWNTSLSGSWTISFKSANIGPNSTLYYVFGDASASSFRCFTNGVAGANNWILRGPITDVLLNGGATGIPTTNTFVYDAVAGQIRAYRNDTLVNTVNQSAFTLSGTTPFKVMGYAATTGAPAGGLLDEFRMYNRALSLPEIASLTSCQSACVGTPQTFTITVNPTPNAVATPSTQTICSGAITPIVLSGNVTGTSYSWTRNETTNVTGIAASGTGDISGNLVNTTTSPITVTFTITPSANDCTGTPITASVVVNPTPNAIANPTTQTVCAGPITTIALSGSVTGTTFNWTRNNTTNVTGIPASGSGNISGTITNNTLVAQTTTFTITPEANGCPGTAITAEVIIEGAPTITCPANITRSNTTGQCGTAVTYTSSATGIPTPAITYAFTGATTGTGSGNGSGSFFNVGTTTVTLTASNACGTATCSFTVTVNDTQAPTVTQGTIASCYATVAAAEAAALAATTAVDNCSGVLNETASTVGTCSAVITVTTTDAAGNSSSVTYNTRIDNVAPTVTTGAIASCYASLAAAEAAALAATSATDNCPGTLTETASTVGTCNAVITVSTSDGCGNTTSVTYTTRIDNIAPTFTCPAAVTVSCAGSVPAADIASVTNVSDNCTGPVIITHVGDVISNQTCANRYTVTRTYRATDGCGNFSECTQIITVNDQTPPSMTCPAAVTVSCAGNVPAANIASVTNVSDNCGGSVTVTHVGDVISNQTCANRYTITRTYRATDVCGNFTECTQIITVNDQTAPVLTCPANITVASIAGTCAVPVSFVPTATDNCAGAVTITSVPASGSSFPVGLTTVTVTATDVCGNSSTCTFTVRVTDSQLPVINIQPEGNNGCVSGSVQYGVVATNVVSYQWQRFAGGTWSNVPNSNSSTLTVSGLTLAMHNDSFRVVVQGLCTAITSRSVLLRVNPLPTVSLAASSTTLLPGQFTTLTATVNPPGGLFQWFRNNQVVLNVAGPVLPNVSVDELGSYRVTYRDQNGCSVTTSPDILISAGSSEKLWVYPNPNQGAFQIRLANDIGENVTVLIYNAKGQTLYRNVFVANAIYSSLNVRLGNVPGGTYEVVVIRGNGKTMETKQVLIVR